MPVRKPLFVWAVFGAVLVLILAVAAVLYYNLPSYDRLIAAIQRGQVDAVKREIALGVDVNRARDVDVPERHSDLFDPMPAYTVYGITPLMEAAGAGEEAMVEALLESGADVAPAANDGKTALHVAAQRVRNLAVVQRLIDAGADVNAGQVRLGWTPLVYAVHFGDAETVEALIRAGAGIPEGVSLLHFAARTGDTAKIRSILDAGAAVEGRDKWGMSPLMWACRPDRLEAVRLLIDAGAEVNARDDRGETALMKASKNWETGEVVGFLLEAGAAIDAAADEGRTALMHAIDSGALEPARALIEAGADVNARDLAGRTPLMYLDVYGEPPAMIDLLLEAGADVHAKDNEGKTVLMHAKLSSDARARLEEAMGGDEG